MLTASTIVTERLVLDPLVEDDAAAMVDVLGDPRMYEFTGGRPLTLDELRSRYRQLAVGRSSDGAELWFNWIVRTPDTATAVGVMQATINADRHAEVAWEIGIEWQGQGWGGEAAAAVVAWLDTHGVRSIRACVHPEHAASAGVARRAGLAPTSEVVDGEIVWQRTAPV